MFRRIFSRFALLAALALPLGFAASSCTDKDGNPLLFSLEDDINLGAQVAAETDSTYRAKGQLLERNGSTRNQRAYQLLDGIVNRVLQSNDIQHRTDFAWDVKIIKDDSVQNAFATPGGHIYVFSGLIKYLNEESHLAGILGHEMAHADRRHTSRQLQNQYGISLLLSVALGENPGQLAEIAAGLGTLKFSRDFEREADQYSVIYLNGPGHYPCDGAAGFFIKAQQENPTATPEFLSTHPNPDNRIQAIQTKATELNCRNRTAGSSALRELQSLL